MFAVGSYQNLDRNCTSRTGFSLGSLFPFPFAGPINMFRYLSSCKVTPQTICLTRFSYYLLLTLSITLLRMYDLKMLILLRY